MKEFDAQLRAAIDGLEAPIAPLDAIYRRSALSAAQRKQKNLRGLYAAIVLAFCAASAAFGAQIFHGISVTFNAAGNAKLYTPTLTCNVRNRYRTLEAIAQYASTLASYHAVLPAGLPAGAKLTVVCNAGPDAMMLSYNYPGQGGRKASITMLIAAPNQLAISKNALAQGIRIRVRSRYGGGQHWRIGEEEVLILSSSLSNAQLDRVKTSMESAAQK